MSKTTLLVIVAILMLGVGAGLALQRLRHAPPETSISAANAPTNAQSASAHATPVAPPSESSPGAPSSVRTVLPDNGAPTQPAPTSPASTPALTATAPAASMPPAGATVSPIGSAEIRINFQHPATHTPDGYLADTGLVFGPRGHGLIYGWVDGPATEARERNALADKRYDSFIHLTKGLSQLGPHQNAPGAPGGSDGADHVWSILVPDGKYHVMLVMGDPTFKDHINSVLINGVAFPDMTVGNDFDTIDTDVASMKGAITIRAAPGAVNPTVCFIHITRLTSP